MKNTLNNIGNVEDIRCTLLQHMHPATEKERGRYISMVRAALNDEQMNRNRKTVINLLTTKLRKLSIKEIKP